MTDIVERLRAADRGKLEWEAAEEIERLRACLKECSDDLAAYIEQEYPNRDWDSQQRRYDRDMVPVIEARKLLRSVERRDE